MCYKCVNMGNTTIFQSSTEIIEILEMYYTPKASYLDLTSPRSPFITFIKRKIHAQNSKRQNEKQIAIDKRKQQFLIDHDIRDSLAINWFSNIRE